MRKPVGKRLLPPATVGALPLDSTTRRGSGNSWQIRKLVIERRLSSRRATG